MHSTCVVSLPTVGYGDLTPTTDFGKVFTICYLCVGVGFIASSIQPLSRDHACGRELRHGWMQRRSMLQMRAGVAGEGQALSFGAMRRKKMSDGLRRKASAAIGPAQM